MKRLVLAAITFLVVLTGIVFAQERNTPTVYGGFRTREIYYGTGAPPSTCSSVAADMFVRTDNASPSPTVTLYICNAANTFVAANTNVNLSRTAKFSATLSPASVGANTCAEQTFTVTGVLATDIISVNKPTQQAGLGIAGTRATAADTVGINFCNATASPIVPTASQVYLFTAIQ